MGCSRSGAAAFDVDVGVAWVEVLTVERDASEADTDAVEVTVDEVIVDATTFVVETLGVIVVVDTAVIEEVVVAVGAAAGVIVLDPVDIVDEDDWLATDVATLVVVTAEVTLVDTGVGIAGDFAKFMF